MRVWRIAREAFDRLDGEGPRRFGGRWNSPGRPVVYTAAHLSLAMVEVLVHTDPDLIPDGLAVFEIQIPDSAAAERIAIHDLPPDWAGIPDHPACRAIGDDWIGRGASAVLAVPSAIVPEETNYLANPLHPDAAGIRVVRSRPFSFDPRLL